MNEIKYKQLTNCRCCNSNNLTKYLDLGNMPLPNNLESDYELALKQQTFPLEVLFCNDCYLSQLSVVVDPSAMFAYYTYRSGINNGYIEHCKGMAKSLKEYLGLNKKSFHIDVAGNDGTLLKQFKDILGHNVLNVDPANNLTNIAIENGVDSLNKFWNEQTAIEIVDKYSSADLITATNVFAHVDDIKGFLSACKNTLSKDGVLVLEFPYVVDFIEKCEFDTVYFEHLSYVGILPLDRVVKSLGLKIFDIIKYDIHGGTVRVMISHDYSSYKVKDAYEYYIREEVFGGFNKIERYDEFSKCTLNQIKTFRDGIIKLKREGANIFGFAASAKGNTLLNSAHIDSTMISCIIDETPEKIGKYSPHNAIPIKGLQTLIEEQPDYIVILSWNFQKEIMDKLRPLYNGKFILPMDDFKII